MSKCAIYIHVTSLIAITNIYDEVDYLKFNNGFAFLDVFSIEPSNWTSPICIFLDARDILLLEGESFNYYRYVKLITGGDLSDMNDYIVFELSENNTIAELISIPFLNKLGNSSANTLIAYNCPNNQIQFFTRPKDIVVPLKTTILVKNPAINKISIANYYEIYWLGFKMNKFVQYLQDYLTNSQLVYSMIKLIKKLAPGQYKLGIEEALQSANIDMTADEFILLIKSLV